MLSYQDSNLDKQNQKLLCYHYTIGQTNVLSVKKRCKDKEILNIFQLFSKISSIFRGNRFGRGASGGKGRTSRPDE